MSDRCKRRDQEENTCDRKWGKVTHSLTCWTFCLIKAMPQVANSSVGLNTDRNFELMPIEDFLNTQTRVQYIREMHAFMLFEIIWSRDIFKSSDIQKPVLGWVDI